jgi:hypothetical protein
MSADNAGTSSGLLVSFPLLISVHHVSKHHVHACRWRPDLSSAAVPESISNLINQCWSGVPDMRPSADIIVSMLEKSKAEIEEQEAKKSSSPGCCTLM